MLGVGFLSGSVFVKIYKTLNQEKKSSNRLTKQSRDSANIGVLLVEAQRSKSDFSFHFLIVKYLFVVIFVVFCVKKLF